LGLDPFGSNVNLLLIVFHSHKEKPQTSSFLDWFFPFWVSRRSFGGNRGKRSAAGWESWNE
jgi:hypothetical protein